MQNKHSVNPSYEDYVAAMRSLLAVKEAGSLPRIIAVGGPSPFLVHRALETFKRSLDKAGFGSVHSIESAELDQRGFDNLWSQASLFEPQSLYILRRANTVKSFGAWLAGIGEASSMRSHLILDIGEKASADLQKQLKRLGGVLVPCVEPTTMAGYNKVAMALAKRLGLNLTTDAIGLLLESTGQDLGKIENELSKLAFQFAGESRCLSPADVSASVGSLREDDVFELFGVLRAGKTAKAHLMLDSFLNRGESAIAITGIFARFAREQLERGSKSRGLAGLRACAEADWKLKSTGIDEALILGNIVAALSGG